MDTLNHQTAAANNGRNNGHVSTKGTVPWKTGPIERIFLFLMLLLLPLEEQLPTIGGRSALWLLFLVVFAYVVCFRWPHVIALLGHRFFLGAVIFLMVGGSIESLHSSPNFEVMARLGQMILGALLIATLCRDQGAFKLGVWGYLAAAIWLAGWLFLNDYKSLRGIAASNFDAATQIRATAFQEKSLAGNLNAMAFFCAQGALAGLVLTLAAKHTWSRMLLALAGLFCLIGAFLPLSRSGVICALAACAAVLWMERSWNVRYLLLIVFLIGGIYFLAPQASLVRAANISLNTHYDSGKLESRARLYQATVNYLPEFFWMGVGCGNFYEQWGLNHGFIHDDVVIGTHNSFFEVTMYWGILGLLSLLAIVFIVYRCIPFNQPAQPWNAFLLGLFVCLVLRMLSSHNLYAKEFSFGFGLLTAADFWIWPSRLRSRESEPANPLIPRLHQPAFAPPSRIESPVGQQ